MNKFNPTEVITTLITQKKIPSLQSIPPTQEEGLLNVEDAMNLIHDLLAIVKPEISFVPAYPSYLMMDEENQRNFTTDKANPSAQLKPTITYITLKEEPSGYGKTKEPFDGYRTYVEKEREVINTGDKSIIIRAKEYDTLIKFELWDISNTEVTAMYYWFRTFLTLLRPYIKRKGVLDMWFWSGGEDNIKEIMRNRINKRALVFYFRTQEQFAYEENNLNKVEVLTASINI